MITTKQINHYSLDVGNGTYKIIQSSYQKIKFDLKFHEILNIIVR